MDKPTIGIRIANGTYFPILQEDDNRKKRVILSPVREDQKDVKIDIFRGEGQGMFNPVYVASLILNNISQSPGSPAEIQLIINVNEGGILDAEGYEPASGVKQLLSISLDSIEENAGFYNMPDSDADDSTDFETRFSAEIDQEDYSPDEENSADFDDFSIDEGMEDESFGDESIIPEEPDNDGDDTSWLYENEKKCRTKNRFLKIAVIILAVIFLILSALLIYTLFMKPALAKKGDKNQVPAVNSSQTELTVTPAAPPAAEKPAAPPVAEAVQPVVQAPPVEKKEIAPVKKAENIRYRIKWGDTLWDISSTYYRTPWLYKKIARDNKIKNPDLIFAGSHLTIKSE